MENTNIRRQAARLRNWCFTTFKVDAFACPNDPIIRYCVFQHEKCPDTNRPHVQGYVELSKPYRIGQVKALFNDDTMHLEPRRGTQQEARDYCMKAETRIQGPWEFGKPWTARSEPGKRTDLVNNIIVIEDRCNEIIIID